KLPVLRRDNAWILKAVAVKREDSNKGSLQRIVDARLYLCRARPLARFRSAMRRLAGLTEILDECGQAFHGGVRRHHAVVIARDGEYGRGIIAIRIVELIVIILSFAKAVHD